MKDFPENFSCIREVSANDGSGSVLASIPCVRPWTLKRACAYAPLGEGYGWEIAQRNTGYVCKALFLSLKPSPGRTGVFTGWLMPGLNVTPLRFLSGRIKHKRSARQQTSVIHGT